MDKTLKNFSKREMECLFYLIHGKTVKATAKKLGLSNRTVESYIDHLKEKLNCSRKSDLVDKAIQVGLIKIMIEI